MKNWIVCKRNTANIWVESKNNVIISWLYKKMWARVWNNE